MSNGYRTLSQHLNDLKKENFSLKLRIYFLEERIQQKYEESSEDVYRTVSRGHEGPRGGARPVESGRMRGGELPSQPRLCPTCMCLLTQLS